LEIVDHLRGQLGGSASFKTASFIDLNQESEGA
jgi:hypothetical protein